MSDEWKQYKPKLALYDVLDKPGGVLVGDALRRAEAQVENYRGQANAALGASVAKLEGIVRAGGTPNLDEIYEQATFVLDIAGIFAPPLCRAAHSLCELVHRMKAAGRWDWPAIAVHVSTMRLLIGQKDDKDPGVVSVLNGLGAVVAKYPDPSPPDPPKPKKAEAAAN